MLPSSSSTYPIFWFRSGIEPGESSFRISGRARLGHLPQFVLQPTCRVTHGPHRRVVHPLARLHQPPPSRAPGEHAAAVRDVFFAISRHNVRVNRQAVDSRCISFTRNEVSHRHCDNVTRLPSRCESERSLLPTLEIARS